MDVPRITDIEDLGQIVAGDAGHAISGVIAVVVGNVGVGGANQIASLIVLEDIGGSVGVSSFRQLSSLFSKF